MTITKKITYKKEKEGEDFGFTQFSIATSSQAINLIPTNKYTQQEVQWLLYFDEVGFKPKNHHSA